MSEQRGNSGDWFYGATASLPRAVEWHTWFEHFQEQYDHSQPIERWMIDAAMKTHQTFIKLAVAVRKNDGWARQFSEVEMAHILDIVGEHKAWYDKTRPTDDALRSLDPRFVFVCRALGGLANVAVALGQEIDQANRKGFVLVDTGSELRELGA